MSGGPQINPDDYDPPRREHADEDVIDFSAVEVPTRRSSQQTQDDSRVYPKGWDPDKAMEALAEEAHILELTPVDQANRLLEEALPLAVAGLVHLSQFGETEKMRFDAQKYLIDRNLGTPSKEGDRAAGEEDPLDRLVGDCVMYIEEEDLKATTGTGSTEGTTDS